ncbi:type IV secretion protein Rhs [Cedecea sp.]|jgi:hypothetical protein|uniref:type IV secretion protein Rhs n=1 Tax=Cedecea sp. TaxID=1970739 RepID=UPI002F41EE6D
MIREMNDIDRGGLRRLTLGEVNLARTLYAFTLRYNEVWIHRSSYLPFNLQNNNYAMSPNGEFYFQEGTYEPYFSHPYLNNDRVGGQHLFLHEMMHVWQHQKGMMVRMRGLFSWAVDYNYTLDKASLLDYGLEQQAAMVTDYWLLKTYVFGNRSDLYRLKDYDPSESTLSLMARYEKVLGRFPH